jgi:hypothetical protein
LARLIGRVPASVEYAALGALVEVTFFQMVLQRSDAGLARKTTSASDRERRGENIVIRQRREDIL